MAHVQPDLVLRQIRKLATGHALGTLSDAELLERFAARQDAAAFETLMNRHDPMVLNVCRRLLHDWHDAEDACQATFLVLARKAGSIRRREAVGCWLYGVAYRIASHARADAATRRAHETALTDQFPADPADDLTWRELRSLLDEELNCLPARYRSPLVLCYLEGQTRDEAAQQLGWSVRTLKRRLEQGRNLLRARLSRRGLTLSAALLAMLLSENTASAAVPATLVAATVQGALRLVAGLAVGTAVSAKTLVLVDAASKSLSVMKLKTTAMLVVTLLVLGAGAGVVAQRASTAQEPKAQPAEGPNAVARAAERAKKEQPKPADAKPPRTDQYGDPLPEGALSRLGTVRWRLPRPAACVLSFAPDGKTFYTASIYGGLLKWDARTGQVLRQILPDDPGQLKALESGGFVSRAFSSDARTLALSSPDGMISILDVETGRERQRCKGHQGLVHSAALSANGQVLVTRSIDQTVRVWDTSTGRQLHQLTAPTNREPVGEIQASSVGISPDGKTLAWIGWRRNDDLMIHVCDVATGKELLSLRGDERGTYRVAFSPDGRMLASISPVRLWDLKTGKRIPTYQDKHNWDSCYLIWTPDSKPLVSSQFTAPPIRLHDAATGKELCRIAADRQWWGMTFSPDGKTLVVYYGQSDPTIHRYDLATGKELLDYPGHAGIVMGLALSTDGRTLASVGRDDRLRVWDVNIGKQLREIPAVNRWFSSAISSDCRWLAAGTHESLYLYETTTGREIWQHAKPASGPNPLAFSPDGQMLATAESDQKITLWDASTGRELRSFAGLGVHLAGMAFFPDGKSLIGCTIGLGTREGTQPNYSCEAAIWETSTGRKRRSLGKLLGHGRFVLSPDGKTMAMVSQNFQSIDFWEIATSKKRLNIAQPSSVVSMAFSPDGAMLMTGNREDPTGAQGGPFRCYDSYTGRLIAERKGHRGVVSALAVSQDGCRLATGSYDTTVLVWNLADLRSAEPPRIVNHSPADMQSLWADLSAKDASKAYRAIGQLIAAPQQTVALLRERLRPAAAADAKHVARLVADLDDGRFAVREKAMADLEKLAELVEPILWKTLASKPSLEVRRRVESLISKLDKPVTSPAQLQTLRALEVLEHIATPEAKQVLESLAKGAPEARLTQEAKASLERLAKRPAVNP